MASSRHDASDPPTGHRVTAEDPDWRRDALKARLFGDKSTATKIGRFIVLGSLGIGGMGSVLRAYDETLDRQVAIKLMHPSVRGQHDRRMLREAKALARLSHPNVVQVYEVGEVDDQLFIAMELISGQTLERWQDDRPSWRRCLKVYLQAGRGLVAAHNAGMIHRDFKPSNCILDEDGRVRVLDFGLARGSELPEVDQEPADASSSSSDDGSMRSSSSGTNVLAERITQTGSILGTIAYMAPEQLHGKETDARADQFSFCVSLYEAIFGRRPFGQNPMKLLLKMSTGEAVAPLPPPKGHSIPGWLLRLLERGLSARPEDRWPSMASLLEQIDRRHRRRPWRWTLIGLGVLGLGVASLRSPPEDSPPCIDAAKEASALWSDEDRDNVRAALHSLDVSYADEAWKGIEPQFDSYTDSLVSAYEDACVATKVRNELTRDDLTRRRSCLDERSIAIREMVSVLGVADRQVAERAVEMVVALPGLEPCMNVDELRQAAAHAPVDDATATEIRRLRERIKRARALMEARKLPEGLEAIDAVIENAEVQQHVALLVEAGLVRGVLLNERGDFDAAVIVLRESLVGALQHDLDSLAVEALEHLIYTVGVNLASADAGTWLGAIADGLVERVETRGKVKARILTVVGQLMTNRGEHEGAQRRIEEAIEQLQPLSGPDRLALAKPFDTLAIVLRKREQFEEALEYSRRSLQLRMRWLGERHPQTAHQHINLGVVLDDLERHSLAQEHFRTALKILEGEQSVHELVGHAHSALGHSLATAAREFNAANEASGEGHAPASFDQAIEQYQRAIAALETVHGHQHPRIAQARLSLGGVLYKARRIADSIDQFERALLILEANETTPSNRKIADRVERALATGRKAAAMADASQDH